MNKTELQNDITCLEKQLEEKKKQLESLKGGIWKPEEGEGYWRGFIDCEATMMTNGGDVLDRTYRAHGNVHPTKEAAEAHGRHLAAKAKLMEYAEPMEFGKVQYKIVPNKDLEFNSCWNDEFKSPNELYFESLKRAREAWHSLTDQEKKDYMKL